LLGPATYDWDDLGQRLRCLIEADCDNGTLVTSRGNRISRKHYAELLDVDKGYLGLKLGEIFVEFEQQQKVATGPMAKFDEMRSWLAEQYQQRTLEFLRGKLDRRPFEQQFGLKGGSYSIRHQQIRDLLITFDERARSEGYLDRVRCAELEAVRKIVAANPPLNRDRLTINRAEIWSKLQIKKLDRIDPKVDGLIRPIEEAILADAVTSKIDPLLHGRRWDFRIQGHADLAAFCTRVGDEFRKAFGVRNEQTTKGTYQAYVRAITWIANSSDHDCAKVTEQARTTGRVQDEVAWENALYNYRAHLKAACKQGNLEITNANSMIKALRSMLQTLSAARIVPELSRELANIKYRRSAKHRPSIVEQAAHGSSQVDYATFVRNTFKACRNPEALGVEAEDEAFIQSIAQAAATVGLPEPSEAILHVLRDRMERLSTAAAELVEAAQASLARGAITRAKADIDAATFAETYLSANLRRQEKNALLRRYFPVPITVEDKERATANMLALIEHQFGGVMPTLSGRSAKGAWGQFFHHRIREIGGVANLEPMLAPTAEAVSAVLSLYLLESGANVEVGRSLLRTGIRKSDVAGHINIVGFKKRKGGAPIIADLPRSGRAASALTWLLNANEEISKRSAEADCLFIARCQSRVQVVTDFTYRAWFKTLAAKARLGDLDLVPNMLRPSVLLEAALSNDGRLAVGMAIGQHSLTVTQGYQQKAPVRLLYDAQIRRFQEILEAAVLSGVPKAAVRLGQPSASISERAHELINTGLGTFCTKVLGRPGERRCSSLSCWDDCPNMVIVARAEPIAWLQIWRESLRRAEGDWMRDQPDRWERLWLPWMCLIDVVEEQMRRGKNLLVWREAERLALTMKSKAGFVPPQPW
jgi:hypothetical protein